VVLSEVIALYTTSGPGYGRMTTRMSTDTM
jgi:hypothetical protein